MSNLARLDGKLAIITGGGSGIGHTLGFSEPIFSEGGGGASWQPCRGRLRFFLSELDGTAAVWVRSLPSPLC